MVVHYGGFDSDSRTNVIYYLGSYYDDSDSRTDVIYYLGSQSGNDKLGVSSATSYQIGSQRTSTRSGQLKFHKAAGHPTNRNLARIVHDAGHPQWKVDVASEFECPTCQSLKSGGTRSGRIPPASTHAQYAPWEAVAIDAAEWVPPGRKVKVKFPLFMDVATKLRVTCPLYVYDFLEMKAESSQDFMKFMKTERWLGTFPTQRVVLMDSAKSLISETTHQYLSDLNILVHFITEKGSCAHGTVEAAVQDVKMTASVVSSDIRHLDSTTSTSSGNVRTKFHGVYCRFSSFQWAFWKAVFSLRRGYPDLCHHRL